jgi:hypothetical protein
VHWIGYDDTNLWLDLGSLYRHSAGRVNVALTLFTL